ncbi:hypothetical protein LCGC14_2922890 [marine sediment metagenome]|uniref:MurNAc-LAA domain-containing protein n=1 Tax=marine sediment metagenome TaxID=412755 RepID=A0A0F9AEA6_9ZZZZ
MKLRWLAPLAVLFLAVAALLAPADSAPRAAADHNSLHGKIIALDAGHGGTELGATYPADSGLEADVYEKDVNLAVVYELKEKLTAAGAQVVLTREGDQTISSRKQRVDIAIEKCKKVPDEGRKCDALISVHHNGSTDPSYDGLLVIYNEKQDLPLANAIHDALWSGLYELYDPPPPGTPVDEGLDHGGYGMTVYGRLVSVLTEAYYITNTWEADQYSAGTPTDICDAHDENCTVVRLGARTDQEADALLEGLANYFTSDGDNGGGGNGCPPGNPNHRKCS